jgi:hypothetical protein
MYRRSPAQRPPITSSPKSLLEDEYTIRDESSLEKYLNEQQQQQVLRAKIENSAVNQLDRDMYFGSTPPVQKYRTARPSGRTVGAAKGQNDQFSYLNYHMANEQLQNLGIASYVEDWTENMRKWLVAYILKDVASGMEAVEKVGLTMLEPLAPPPAPITSPLWFAPQTPQTSLSEYMSKNPQNPYVQERFKLEEYMNVLGCTSREYLVQRIKALAEGDCLGNFVWNGGSKWKAKEWTAELPTDSQIIIHMFCTYMDSMMPRFQVGKPFTSRHFVVFPQSLDKVKTSVVIYQPHVHPPHFEGYANKNVIEVVQGRNNLFMALVIFIYNVKTHLDGYLDQLWLGSKSVNLLSVVQS